MSASQGWLRAGRVGYFGLPALVIGALTENPGLTVFAVASLLAIVLLVWRQGEAPILLFVCFMQWLQGSLKLLQADLQGVPVWTLAESHSTEMAIGLTVAWAVAIAVGIRLVLVAKPQLKWSEGLDTIAPTKLFNIYIVWTLIVQVLGPFAVGGLRQIVVAVADIRWAAVFALFWSAFSQRRHYGLVAGVFAFELVTGLFSFFSSFKTPIYVLALALPAGNFNMRPRHIVGSLFVAAFALYLAVIWTAIKAEYRNTISGGTMEQTVTISRGDQAEELIRLFGTVDSNTLDRGVVGLVDRVAYIEFFAMALDFVPAVRPHEDGLLWGNAFRHVLMPRLFFPGKADLESDTENARRYTGAELTSNPTTSISIGTPAESYVDFGVAFMFIPALCLGVLYGLLSRHFAAYGSKAALAQGFTVGLLVSLGTVELTPAKLLGGLLMRLIVAALLWQLILPMVARMGQGNALGTPAHPH